ncbi:uncharacterized protein KQ657_002251 [Scheffersomyces spartinae]|uniref:Uncharacterized protein n=1 Tax=Scheffersomyces spartinae TaxID=45513 RepID=A0A9P7VEP2_9ASCO|nr:uncharacterized protein KQ657_002251 [Scheffersomyces spartinae]KAG7195866.1 hypothetical protein KQ657_002251 [Scheffersomyces spartinae]
MYLPSSFPKDIYWLWDKQEQESPPIHKRKIAHSFENSTSGNGARPLEQITDSNNSSDARRQVSNLYATPLVGYSAEFPGAQLSYLDYNIRRLVVGEDNVSFRLSHTPLVLSRLERLRRIKTHGYRTIRPVGVDKTLEEFLIANSRPRAESGPTADLDTSRRDDNLRVSTMTTGTENDLSSNNNSSGLGLGISENFDLDAGILDADISREIRDDEFEDNENDDENEQNVPNSRNNVTGVNASEVDIQAQTTMNSTGDSYNVDYENYRVGQDTTGEDMNYENILLHNSNANANDPINDTNDNNAGNEDEDSAIPGFMAEDVEYQDGTGDRRDILISTTHSHHSNDLLARVISMANSASSRSLPSNPTTTWASPGFEYSRHSIDLNRDDEGTEDDPNMEIDE